MPNVQVQDDGPDSSPGPRIPWSVIAMGASVLVTLALNYASYDKRITVLEKSVVGIEDRNTKLSSKVDDLLKKYTTLIAIERDVKNNTDRVKRLENQQDNKKGG